MFPAYHKCDVQHVQFEMETKEAVLDAIAQLKAQGVDVRSTIPDYRMCFNIFSCVSQCLVRLQERVLRHYLQHDMSAYRNINIDNDNDAENAEAQKEEEEPVIDTPNDTQETQDDANAEERS